jgi:hypothetical protein
VSILKIRTALETALNGMLPVMTTAWENMSFAPVNGTPYQIAHLMLAKPSNREFGARHQERGYLQVRLMYPQLAGTAAAAARAELLRTTFKRGNTFASGGVTTLITETPEVTAGTVEGDRFAMAVKIPFTADIN